MQEFDADDLLEKRGRSKSLKEKIIGGAVDWWNKPPELPTEDEPIGGSSSWTQRWMPSLSRERAPPADIIPGESLFDDGNAYSAPPQQSTSAKVTEYARSYVDPALHSIAENQSIKGMLAYIGIEYSEATGSLMEDSNSDDTSYTFHDVHYRREDVSYHAVTIVVGLGGLIVKKGHQVVDTLSMAAIESVGLTADRSKLVIDIKNSRGEGAIVQSMDVSEIHNAVESCIRKLVSLVEQRKDIEVYWQRKRAKTSVLPERSKSFTPQNANDLFASPTAANPGSVGDNSATLIDFDPFAPSPNHPSSLQSTPRGYANMTSPTMATPEVNLMDLGLHSPTQSLPHRSASNSFASNEDSLI